MNHKQINAFRFVMRYGSITAAAKHMNVSQPAVSRLIGDLEAHLGFPLFLREAGRIFPTPEARDFADEVERMYSGLDRLARIGAEIRELRRATFRVASLPMLSFGLLPRALKRFLAEHEGVKITYDVYASERVIDLVSSSQVDLGVAQMLHLQRHDLRLLASYRSHCVCAVPVDHPLRGRASLGPADLSDVPLVILAHHTLTAAHIVQRFAEASVPLRVAVESQPSYAACAMAASGLGIAVVDPLSAGMFGPTLVAIPFQPAIPFDIHVVQPVASAPSRAAQLFSRHLLTVLDEVPDLIRLDHKSDA